MPKCRKGKVVENRVGRRYRKAGYNVKLRKRTPSGEVDIYATRKGERIAGEVKYRSKKNAVPPKEVKKVAKKARSLKAKPVLILSGSATLSKRRKRLARKMGVRVRKV